MLVIDLLIILLPILDHRVQYRSQLLACCHHCWKISAFRFYVSEVAAHRVVKSVECVGALAQHQTDRILFVRHATGQELAARYLVVRHQIYPTYKVPRIQKLFHEVETKLRCQTQGCVWLILAFHAVPVRHPHQHIGVVLSIKYSRNDALCGFPEHVIEDIDQLEVHLLHLFLKEQCGTTAKAQNLSDIHNHFLYFASL